MSEFIPEYGLFLAKTVTALIALAVALLMLVSASRARRPAPDSLEVTHLNEKYRRMRQTLRRKVLDKKALKQALKSDKQDLKCERKSDEARKRVFVLDFHGDIRASAVASLREEITAVLSLATPEDEVLVRLENAGGLVHEHGLAASQLTRIQARGIPLTIAVDKVAASGGYLMACVADRIIAAPFAILGSIGVLAQIPNFHRLLERHGVDFEQFMAGEHKRTVTMFGENTQAGRDKMKAHLEETHDLFKTFVGDYRPQLEIARVATGEYWHGTQALELALIDSLSTSDDYLLEASTRAELYKVTYKTRRKFAERLASGVREGLDKALQDLSAR